MWFTQLAAVICGGMGAEVELCCCNVQSGLVRCVYMSGDRYVVEA